jgi:hypothetical protein
MTPSVTDLEAMERAALITTWDQIVRTPVPKRLSSPFLRRFIAFELQSQQNGGLTKGFAKSLQKYACDNGDVRRPTLKPGGRLIREWNGATHVVDVVDGGFLWNGQRFASLSPIASAITGARWSGPRFFGLKKLASR